MESTVACPKLNKRWIKNETLPELSCGNEIEFIVLPSKETLITSVFIFKGGFRTLLRLKIGNSYSKAFTGTINKSQFF